MHKILSYGRRMNIIVDCEFKQVAEHIGFQVKEFLKLDSCVNYEVLVRMDRRQIAQLGHDGCVVVQGPQTVEEYRKLSENLYSPDLIICITSGGISSRRDNLLRFYEERVSVFHMDSHENVSDVVINYINEEVRA